MQKWRPEHFMHNTMGVQAICQRFLICRFTEKLIFPSNMSIQLIIIDLLVNMNVNTNSKIVDRQFNCGSFSPLLQYTSESRRSRFALLGKPKNGRHNFSDLSNIQIIVNQSFTTSLNDAVIHSSWQLHFEAKELSRFKSES